MLVRIGCFVAVIGLAGSAQPLLAQRATIKNASATLITQTAAEYLASSGFLLVRNDSNGAEFGLNRGKIPQHGLSRSLRHPDNLFWVIMEVHLQYKTKADGVEVSVYEDVVVLEDDSSLVERRRVRSHSELNSLRAFLDDLRKEVEARIRPADVGKP